ncbi:type VI secretion system-associated FHA domain protein TagH [Elioraea sp.]|uniref:type VI secretion system-associated FHA domain protein TagH n=1 Tax=Elioraea sp. TaxID=2185103 RepID=UPI003F705743
MDLVLSIVRCPDAAVPESRSFGGGEVVIGRGEDCSWKLADPDQHLSRRHCSVAFRGGAWRVTDLSTNGTHVNRSPTPIGKGNEVPLHDGDRLTLGEYEIEVRIQDAGSATIGGIGGLPAHDDPFAPFTSEPPVGPGRVDVGGPLIPDDFSPDAPGPQESEPWHGGSRPDHTPAGSDFYAPPRVSTPVIPDDFDLDAPPGKPSAPPSGPGGKLPDAWDLDEPLTPPQPPARPAEPLPPGSWDLDAPPAPPGPPTLPAHQAPPPPAAAPPPVARAPEPAAAPGDAALLNAFLDGMGLAGIEPGGPDPATLMKGLGAAFRAFVEGLREVLITRATIKSEFRIEQTIIAARGNNPLKFSPTPEDALVAMLGRSRAFMAPEAAVKDALDDIKRHEIATMEAMQAAVRGLLARLDPAAIRTEAEQGGGLSLLPAQKRARAFELYEQRFAAALADLDDSSDGAFARVFAKAYEAASGKR